MSLLPVCWCDFCWKTLESEHFVKLFEKVSVTRAGYFMRVKLLEANTHWSSRGSTFNYSIISIFSVRSELGKNINTDEAAALGKKLIFWISQIGHSYTINWQNSTLRAVSLLLEIPLGRTQRRMQHKWANVSVWVWNANLQTASSQRSHN